MNASGVLYVVSTPIGNLEDITLRALRILGEADAIAAEDTRHAMKLLTHHNISKPLISYWGEREKTRAEEVIGMLGEGKDIALISDSGTPGISDPGSVVIRRAIEEGFEVIPIPGPSAFLAALSVSGIQAENFVFIGFLPPKKAQREKALKELLVETRAMIFYEAPHRLFDTLADMEEIFGPEREASVSKEITKLHEETFRGTLSEILDAIEDKTIAGEYVIIISGRQREEGSVDEALKEMRSVMKKGMGRNEAAKKIAKEYGLRKKELYDRSLKE